MIAYIYIFFFSGKMKSTIALFNDSTVGHRFILQSDEEKIKTPGHSVVDSDSIGFDYI